MDPQMVELAIYGAARPAGCMLVGRVWRMSYIGCRPTRADPFWALFSAFPLVTHFPSNQVSIADGVGVVISERKARGGSVSKLAGVADDG